MIAEYIGIDNRDRISRLRSAPELAGMNTFDDMRQEMISLCGQVVEHVAACCGA